MNSDEKLCTFCGETIKAVAIKCKHCQSNLIDESIESEDSNDSNYAYYRLKRIQKTIWSVLIICGVLFFTNPTKQEFVSWAQLKVYSYANQHAGSLGVGLAALVGGPIINNSVSRQNFYLFSIFTLDPNLVRALIDSSQKSDTKRAMVGLLGLMYFPVPQNIYDFFDKLTSASNQQKPKDSNNQSRNTSKISSPYHKYVGQHPTDFLSASDTQVLLNKNINNLEIKKIVPFFAVASPIIQQDQYLIGDGCMAHECSTSNGIFYIDLKTNFFALFTYVNEIGKGATIQSYCDNCSGLKSVPNGFQYDSPAPVALKEWFRERNFNVIFKLSLPNDAINANKDNSNAATKNKNNKTKETEKTAYDEHFGKYLINR